MGAGFVRNSSHIFQLYPPGLCYNEHEQTVCLNRHLSAMIDNIGDTIYMKRYKTILAGACSAFLLATSLSLPTWAADTDCPDTHILVPADDPAGDVPPYAQLPSLSALRAAAFGPGVQNLSVGDRYAIYQWGLKNDGEFQLIQMTTTFRSLDSVYGKRKGRSSSISLPDLGPGMLESQSTVIRATPGIDINILPAWAQYDAKAPEEKRQVVVAVIDTGIDLSHPDLKDAIWTNPGEIPGDGVDNDGNGYVDDIHGWNFYTSSPTLYSGTEDSHGTHTAGTIAAARGSGGVAGIADSSQVKLMCLKALGGPYGIGSPDSVIRAIRYAEANGASICNLSLGTSSYSQELADTIRDSHMLFIVASGNGDSNGQGYDIDAVPVYPASLPFDNVIAVSGLLFDGSLAASSNFGAMSVDIAAPSAYILSTAPEGGYAFMSGTSMAAPMVTGTAAMVYSYRTDLALSDIKNVLLASSRPLEGLQGKSVSSGMLDAHAALSYGLPAADTP